MHPIFNFRVEKKRGAFFINKKLVKFIKSQSESNSEILIIVNSIFKNTALPKKIIQQKVNQILFKKFNYKKNKFIDFEISKIKKDFFIYLGMNLINILGHIASYLFKFKVKQYDLICDNVFNEIDYDRYSRLIKKFKKVCLIGTKFPEKKIKNKDYFKYNFILLGFSSLNIKQKIFFFLFAFKILNLSLRSNINLFCVFNILIYEIFKSAHIFSKIQSKFYLTNKFYQTSPIFNFYFKKNGGKITSCTQKNILAQSISLFVYSDIMFTLGKNQGKICNKLGGKIKKFIAVGSLFMEDSWYKKKKDFKNVPEADILIIGINTLNNQYHYVNNNYRKDYYDIYLNWLKKLAKDFPKKKIILKHHNDYTVDPIEKEKLNNTSIKVVINNASINSTYAYAFKSKFIFSFASTMILELLGNNKLAYFLDPGLRGDQWFKDIDNLKKYRINSYKKLKKIISESKDFPIHFKSYYCENSNNTSELIYKNLLKFENLCFDE